MDFSTIDSNPDLKSRCDKYLDFLLQSISKQSSSDLLSLFTHMMEEKVPLSVSRVILQEYAAHMKALQSQLQKTTAQHIFAKSSPRATAFEDQLSTIRNNLSVLYESEGDIKSAIDQLMQILADKTIPNQQSSNSSTSTTTAASASSVNSPENSETKIMLCVRIAELQLKIGNIDQAASVIMRASDSVLNLGNKSTNVTQAHKAMYARVLDRKGEFIKAAQRFYELSQSLLSDSERKSALEHAITSAVLAEAGPERSRMLSTLYKDERTQSLPEHSFLQKVYLEHVLRSEDISSFSNTLQPHQKQALNKSVIEHNLLSASRVYENVAIDELGRLLGISSVEAERVAAKMIFEHRLNGSIDQIDELIVFESDVHNPLESWDKQIESVCHLANNTVDAILEKHPQLKVV